MTTRPHTLALALVITMAVSFPEVVAGAASERVDYSKVIKPILRERCYSCHGALQQKSGLRLDTAALARKGGEHGPAVVTRKPEQSPLLLRITAADSAERMPRDGDALKPEQISLIRRWIAEGAVAPAGELPEPNPRDHWAFKPIVRPPVPAVQSSKFKVQGSKFQSENSVDSFINATLDREKLTPLPPAAKNVQLRRVYLDLIGLPPTREELHAFLDDPSPQAYERVVDRLLDDPRHGERWARHWMDVWRYADWFGRRMVPDVWNSAPQIWRWRDWIVNSLNADKGYDRMIAEMLAGDEVAPERDEIAVATGYLVRNWYALNPNEWMRANVEHTGRAFLGLSFQCAHCHDHKYDPISQQDYFNFRAFFEPLYVRQDRWPGEADPGAFQDYNYSALRKVQRLGAVRVFDKDAAAKTWFYTGGDERNRVTNRPPAQAAMPGFLGGASLQVSPVALPADAFFPGLRNSIVETELAQRRAAIATAESELAAARKSVTGPTQAQRGALAKAEAEFAQAVAEAAKSGKPAALSGSQSLVFDATTGRRILNNPVTALKSLPEGTAVSLKLKLLAEGYANFQLAKDTAAGLTAGYVGFKKGRIISYSPGTTAEFDAGEYAFTNGQTAFQVTLVIEPKADRALLTVTTIGDNKVLVDKTPVAINGWNPTKHTNQGITLDVQAGTVAAWDDIAIESAAAGFAPLRWDFEPPAFAEGRDIVGTGGWTVSKYCTAPATSLVSAIALAPGLREKQQAVHGARQAIAASQIALTAADARLAAARAELAGVEARFEADRAKHGATPVATNKLAQLAIAAGKAERSAAVLSAKAKLATAQHALADAEGKPVVEKARATAITAATKPLADAQAALAKAEAALADPKLAETYTPTSPVYPKESTGRRKALAEWMGARENPLTARVAVNHVWLRHFHAPLVETVDNFGRSGAKPTHPELLDWLAAELMESGWSLKHLHRVIVTSAAYRRGSEYSVFSFQFSVRPDTRVATTPTEYWNLNTEHLKRARETDPENKRLWRMNTGRSEAEVIRDGVLHLAGNLDPKMGGQELENPDMANSARRSLYFACFPELGGSGEFTSVFDPPNPNECYRRTKSVVPQQALALANSKLIHDQSVALAKRLGSPGASAAGVDDSTFITAAFEHILTRSPRTDETDACLAYLAKPGHSPPRDGRSPARESLVRALLNHSDFVTVR